MNGASASRQRHAPPDNRPPDNSLAPPAPSPPRKRPQTAGGASARGAVTREGGYETTAPPRPPRRGRQGGETTETQRGAGNKNGRVRVEGAACAPSHNGGRRLVHQHLAREREGEDRLGWGRRCGEWAARAPQAVARSRPNGWRAIIRPARCLSRATERPCSVRAARKRGTNVSAAGGHRPTAERWRLPPFSLFVPGPFPGCSWKAAPPALPSHPGAADAVGGAVAVVAASVAPWGNQPRATPNSPAVQPRAGGTTPKDPHRERRAMALPATRSWGRVPPAPDQSALALATMLTGFFLGAVRGQSQ